MYSPLPKGLKLAPSVHHGHGVWTTIDLPEGTIIGTTHKTDERFEDGLIRTPLGGYLNHSTVPNCQLQRKGDLYYLVTLEDIPANRELVITYTIYNPLK
jgi:hypothetical protein